MTRMEGVVRLAGTALLVLAGCNPNLLQPEPLAVGCGEGGECPSDRRCLAGWCRAVGDVCTRGALGALELLADGSDCARAESGQGLCIGGACVAPRCGDGFVAEGEGCDEGAANADSPGAACRSDCTPRRCGDGVVDLDSGEECEPGRGEARPCEEFGSGFHAGAAASCTSSCLFDRASCPRCGDGEVNGDETCDGAAPGGLSCMGLGFDAGRVGCNPLTCQPELSTCVRWGWRHVETGVRADLNDLAGPADGSFIYAVGDDGVVLRYHDGRWRRIPAPTTANLERVVVASVDPELAWAAGQGGTVLRLTGAGVEAVQGPPVADDLNKDLLALAACGNGAIVAASRRSVSVFRDGWTSLDFSEIAYFASVVDVACVDNEPWVVAVGEHYGVPRIFVWRDGSWAEPAYCDAAGVCGQISLCNGGAASLDLSGSRVAIACRSHREETIRFVVYAFDRTGFTLTQSIPETVLSGMTAPEARWSPGGDLWLYGGGLLGYFGPRYGWFAEELDLPTDLRAGWHGSDGLSYVVGAGGVMLTYTGYGRRLLPTPPGFYTYEAERALCLASGGRLFAFEGTNLLELRKEDRSWQQVAATPNGEYLMALDCSPSSDLVCASGRNGYVGCYDLRDGVLTSLRSGTSDEWLRDLWRGPDGSIVVANYDPTVWRWDGAWSELPLEAPEGLTPQSWLVAGWGNDAFSFDRWTGVTRYTGDRFALTPLSGEHWKWLETPVVELWAGPDLNGESSVVVVNDAGKVLMLQDGEVTRDRIGKLVGQSTPKGFWGSRIDDLFLVQSGGDAYRFDGEQWSPVRFPPLDQIFAITGGAADSIYVAGSVRGAPAIVQVRYPKPIGR